MKKNTKMSADTLHILIVEDDADHLELIRYAFASNGNKFHLTSTGTLAGMRKILNEITPDLMLADYRLPDGESIGFLPGSPDKLVFPIAIMISQGDERIAAAVIKAGAIDYIVKSVETFTNMPQIVDGILRKWGYIIRCREAENALHKLSSAMQQMDESVLITDKVGVIEYANPAFEKMTGYTIEEAIGQTPRLLKSGNQDAAFYKKMWDTITAGEIWHGKVIDRKKDGSFYPAMLNISPVVDVSGEVTHFVGVQSDISALEDMEARFHQAQKMEALGTMVGGIAHNFNNMLAGIVGNMYLAKMKVQNQPDVIKKLTTVEELSHQAANMIQQLLTFARKGVVSMQAIPFVPFVSETLKSLRVSVPENIILHQDICSDDLTIKGDATQLHQILMNLVNNARDALNDVGEPHISIKLEACHVNEMDIQKHPDCRAGLYAHLSVEDNGCGIPEHQLEHLFEPFFTTKEQGEGTGLGLSMVFGSAETHGGFVEVESVQGTSSTFHVYLPLLETDEEVPFAVVAEGEAANGQGELVLLADDEAMVREIIGEVLESFGYKVLLAEDGLAAEALFKEHQTRIRLAVLDVVMPHAGGMQLTESIREINPELPIIFLTGYDKEKVLGGIKPMPNSEILTKPVNFGVLKHSIRKLLD